MRSQLCVPEPLLEESANRMASEVGRGAAALLLAIALAACAGVASPGAGLAPPTAATPAPARTPVGGWTQGLEFSGDVQGGMDHVVPDSKAMRSECSGRNSRPARAWASALFGRVDGDVFEVLVTVAHYRGPGAYQAPDVTVQVARPDGSAVW